MSETHPFRRKLYTVKQISEIHPGITERTLRHWIFEAKERKSWEGGKLKMIPSNGFEKVMIRKGTKILIDEMALITWLECGS